MLKYLYKGVILVRVKYPTIDDIDIIEMYKEKLKGTRKTFVKGVWQRPDAILNAIKVTKYLIEEELKLSDKELKEEFSFKLFRDNSLGGMLCTCFNNSPYQAINTALISLKSGSLNKYPKVFGIQGKV